LLYGWVDAELLGPGAPLPRPPTRPQPAVETPPIPRAAARITCQHAVAIAAEVEGEGRFIGHVAPGKVMGVELDEAGGFLLAVEGAAFAPQSYSEIRVRNDDLRGCRRAAGALRKHAHE
jgi:hypothetical protein